MAVTDAYIRRLRVAYALLGVLCLVIAWGVA